MCQGLPSFTAEYKQYSGSILDNLVFYEVAVSTGYLADFLVLKDEGAFAIGKRSDAVALYDVNQEIARITPFIIERSGIDISSI